MTKSTRRGGQLVPISFRVTSEMKIRIDAEALETGQTQGQVCERHLRRSFERDEANVWSGAIGTKPVGASWDEPPKSTEKLNARLEDALNAELKARLKLITCLRNRHDA